MKTVFTAGCFDHFHEGHLNLLKRARALGDRLFVAINSDDYIRKTKGTGRPIDNYYVRAKKLWDTGLVDSVIEIEDSPLAAILDLEPDIIVAGDDYTIETCVGSQECKQWGGFVVILPRTPGVSTTQIAKDIRTLDARCAAFQKAINQIDDYFEYRCESQEDRKMVYAILDQLSSDLNASR